MCVCVRPSVRVFRFAISSKHDLIEALSLISQYTQLIFNMLAECQYNHVFYKLMICKCDIFFVVFGRKIMERRKFTIFTNDKFTINSERSISRIIVAENLW